MPSELQQWASRIATEVAENRAKFAETKKSAFVLGHTGESGKALVDELVKSKVFSRIVLIGRREMTFEDEAYQSLEQKVVDFDKIGEYGEAFSGIDVGFCCLGTTKAKSGKDGFYRVDHDYVVNSAKVAKDAGCSHFNCVSSMGASKNSWLLYPKTKGQVEDELSNMGFDRVSIYRPGMLLCERENRRIGETVALGFLKPIVCACPTAMSIPTTTLAKAMVNATVSAPSGPVEVLENKIIHKVSGELEAKKAT